MLRAPLLFLAVALVAVGCKPGQEVVQFPARPKHYQTVASLNPGATEVVGSLAYQLKLVGRTAACDFPPSVTSAPVVAQVKPDYEKLKAQSPSLVVYDVNLFSADDIAQIKALGMDVFEFKASTVEEFADNVKQFGSLVGSEIEASLYADKMLQERRAAIAVGPKPAPRVAVVMPGKGGEHYIAGTKSFHADLARSGGGEAVGPEADRFVPINAEALIKLNPDMIVTIGPPDRLTSDPRLASMSAIAKGKVRGLDERMAGRMGYRVDRVIRLVGAAISDMAGASK